MSVLSDSGVRIEDIAHLVGHRHPGYRLVYRQELRPVIQTGATAMDQLFSLRTVDKQIDKQGGSEMEKKTARIGS